jgi:hypothetical protein
MHMHVVYHRIKIVAAVLLLRLTEMREKNTYGMLFSVHYASAYL